MNQPSDYANFSRIKNKRKVAAEFLNKNKQIMFGKLKAIGGNSVRQGKWKYIPFFGNVKKI